MLEVEHAEASAVALEVNGLECHIVHAVLAERPDEPGLVNQAGITKCL